MSVMCVPKVKVGGERRSTTRKVYQREVGRIGDPSKGTTFVAIGGVHGNERAGLIAGQRVLDWLNDTAPINGRFILLSGNLAALNHDDSHTRYVDTDLNRLCTEESFNGKNTEHIEHAEMIELFAALESIASECASRDQEMVVLDLHTTSAPSSPVVAFEDSISARRFAMDVPCAKYLGIEEEASGLVIDAATRRFGCVTYLIEGGQHDDPISIDVHEAGIILGLERARIIDHHAAQSRQWDSRDAHGFLSWISGEDRGRIFDVRDRVGINHPSFTMLDNIESGMRVDPGDPVAKESGQLVRVQTRGRIFLPNMQRHKRVGDDGFFIVREVGDEWMSWSGSIRRSTWIHTLITHLPGVYRASNGRLLVDAQVACVLRRQVFHLFGYRLIRQGEDDGLLADGGKLSSKGLSRLFQGINAFASALLRVKSSSVDETDPRFWIVERHHLDQRAL